MPTPSCATKPRVWASTFGEQQLYDFHMATLCCAFKPIDRVSAFSQALYNQIFVTGGCGTPAIIGYEIFVFQIIQSGCITLIPGAENFYFCVQYIFRFHMFT